MEVTAYLREYDLPLTFPLVAVDGSTYISRYRPEDLSRVLGLD